MAALDWGSSLWLSGQSLHPEKPSEPPCCSIHMEPHIHLLLPPVLPPSFQSSELNAAWPLQLLSPLIFFLPFSAFPCLSSDSFPALSVPSSDCPGDTVYPAAISLITSKQLCVALAARWAPHATTTPPATPPSLSL